MALPYRLIVQPSTVSQSDADALNVTRKAKGILRFENSLDALARIRDAKSASPDRLRSWIWHPSEAVPIAVLANSAFSAGEHALNNAHLHTSLYQRALEDAQSQGLMWTPLLDAIGAHHAPGYGVKDWLPSDSHVTGRLPVNTGLWTNGRMSILDSTGDRAVARALPLRESLAPLIRWVADQTSRDEIRPLFASRTDVLRESVAEVATCLTREDVASFLDDSTVLVGTAVVSNPAVHQMLGDEFWTLLLDNFERMVTVRMKNAYSHFREFETRVSMLIAIVPPRRDHFERLTDLLCPRDPKAMSPIVRHAEGYYIHDVSANVIKQFGTLWPTDLYRHLVMNYSLPTYARSRVVVHPAMTEAILEELATATSDFPTRLLIAKASGQVESPRVRQELMKSTSAEISAMLFPGEQSPRKAKSLLRKSVKTDKGIGSIVEAIEEPEQWRSAAHLSFGDLSPILTSLHIPVSSEQIAQYQATKMHYSGHESLHHRLTFLTRCIRRLNWENTHQEGSLTRSPMHTDRAAIDEALNTAWHSWKCVLASKKHDSKSNGNYFSPIKSQADADHANCAAIINRVSKDSDVLSRFTTIELVKEALQHPDKDVRLVALRLIPLFKKAVTSEEVAIPVATPPSSSPGENLAKGSARIEVPPAPITGADTPKSQLSLGF